MFDKISEIIKIALPPIITGFMGFMLSKQKNNNLNNMIISYKEVYFPLYKYIIFNKYNNDKEKLIEYSKNYIETYFIYIDKSTYYCFQKFEEKKDDKTLNEFENNIKQINSHLRKKLNYLESNSFSTYSFSTTDKKLFYLFIYTALTYLFNFMYNIFIDNIILNIIFISLALIFLIASTILLLQLFKNIF